MEKKRILTGDRPTGPLHLGHYAGSLKNRVKLQHDYETFVIVADVQFFTTHHEHPELLKENVRIACLDYMAAGLDPDACTIFIQSQIPEIAELTVFYSMLVTINQLRHNPTIKTEAKQYGFGEGLSYGFLGYPVSQAADISFCRAHLVPVGADQVPHVEMTRKIVRRFNELYGETLVEPEALVGEVARLAGLDGNSKMSKSLKNCINLSDSPEVVAGLVGAAVTDPARIHVQDLGHPDICNVFSYQKAFNPSFIPELEANCKAGKIGCVACKKTLIKAINELLDPMRERRKHYEEHPDLVTQILETGTRRAQEIARVTMADVRRALKIDYF
jgi:tryptophanyl-tRNA synthetase